MLSSLRLAIRLFREPRVPWLTKALPLLAAVYVVSPIDLLPDTLPIIGELDDLTILIVALVAFVRLCPKAAIAFHRTAIAQGRRYSPMRPTDDVIDVEWRRD